MNKKNWKPLWIFSITAEERQGALQQNYWSIDVSCKGLNSNMMSLASGKSGSSGQRWSSLASLCSPQNLCLISLLHAEGQRTSSQKQQFLWHFWSGAKTFGKSHCDLLITLWRKKNGFEQNPLATLMKLSLWGGAEGLGEEDSSCAGRCAVKTKNKLGSYFKHNQFAVYLFCNISSLGLHTIHILLKRNTFWLYAGKELNSVCYLMFLFS